MYKVPVRPRSQCGTLLRGVCCACAGIGSPGTVQEVLRGYVGDSQAKPVFDSPTPFDVLGTG